MRTKLLGLFLLSIAAAGLKAQCHVAFTWQQTPNSDTFTFTADSVTDMGQGLSGNPRFIWSFANGSSAVGQTVTTQLNLINGGTSSYLVCLNMSDSLTLCNVTVCDTVTIPANVTGGCNASVSYTSQDSLYTFTAGNQGTPPFTYAWSVNGQAGGAGAVLTQVIIDTVAGTYTHVCVTVTDATGCVATNCADVPAASTQGACNVYVAYTHQDSVYTFIASPIGVGPFVYTWTYLNNLISSTGDTATLVLDSPALTAGATVCVSATSANGCAATACVNIAATGTGGGPCQAYFQIYPDTLNNGGVDTSGNYYGYNLSTGNYGSNILWNFGDGTTSTNPYPTHTYADSGLYIVCLTVGVPGTSCYSTYCDSSFYVTRALLLMHSLTIIGPTGINTPVAGAGLSVYPDPVNSQLNISAAGGIGLERIFTVQGEKIFESRDGDNHINVSNFSPGIYILELTANGVVTRVKFVKE